MNNETGIGLAVAVLLVLFVAGLVKGVWMARAGAFCFSKGYPSAQVSYINMQSYCIKRVDQTDVVIPTNEL